MTQRLFPEAIAEEGANAERDTSSEHNDQPKLFPTGAELQQEPLLELDPLRPRIATWHDDFAPGERVALDGLRVGIVWRGGPQGWRGIAVTSERIDATSRDGAIAALCRLELNRRILAHAPGLPADEGE